MFAAAYFWPGWGAQRLVQLGDEHAVGSGGAPFAHEHERAVGEGREVIREICRRVARSEKLALMDMVELLPTLDADGRAARTAARLITTLVHDAMTARWGALNDENSREDHA